MVFKAGQDPNRHLMGRTPNPDKKKREAAEKSKLRKLRLLLNKHIADAIDIAADLMHTASKEETKLRAAVFITDQYVKVHGNVIAEEISKESSSQAGNGDDTLDDDSQDDSAAVFSLNIVNK